ncbi:hypothetical protein [Segniliparus rugosus]|uniref:Uncharacterized protein n=1 Tax=Segniliparus rugosus (strain ATCC BAA-974 / DSM 45345 / CCUG 50838 / CIP 108380 / JCM 13579 / CDC 945) TaxID=679197 RepID=E5XU80_SEGRC|nr:hypothetical protein [Segniliparus rugosus]EFV12079.1 hypothetical protein HMPREF9336_03052 [Segniliparus rugosus ATCC BAA-974]
MTRPGEIALRAVLLSTGAACWAGLLVAPSQAQGDSCYAACEPMLAVGALHGAPVPDPIQLRTADPRSLADLTVEAKPDDAWNPLCAIEIDKDYVYLARTRADDHRHSVLIEIEYSKTGYDLRKALVDNRASMLRNAADSTARGCPDQNIVADSLDEEGDSLSWYFRARFYSPTPDGVCEASESFRQTIVADTSHRSHLVTVSAIEPSLRVLPDHLPPGAVYDEDIDPQLLDAIGDQVRDGIVVRDPIPGYEPPEEKLQVAPAARPPRHRTGLRRRTLRGRASG